MRKIRKTQQNLVEKAEKQGFAEQNIEYLRTATCPIYRLNFVFAMMQKEPQSTEVIDKLAILDWSYVKKKYKLNVNFSPQ